ncbi:hypothetical protein [Streptomyces chartreusis]|uniref:hypothetical protein n=1 Tax=Streptomyces chartreusis TaxID=1969 RepID=UPI00380C8071
MTVRRAFNRVIAHLRLLGRHRTTVVVGGYHWQYCCHRSHRLRLPCWRWFIHDGYCRCHNGTCWSNCPEAILP